MVLCGLGWVLSGHMCPYVVSIDQVNLEQGTTFLGRNSSYAYDFGASLELINIGRRWSGELALLRKHFLR